MGRQSFWKYLPVFACPAGLFFYLFFTRALPPSYGIFLPGTVYFLVRDRRTGGRLLTSGIYSLFLILFYLAAGFFLPAGLYRGVAFFLLLAGCCFLLYFFVYRERGGGRSLLYFSFFSAGLGFFGLIFSGNEGAKIFPAYLLALGLGMVVKSLVTFVVSKRRKEYNSPGELSR